LANAHVRALEAGGPSGVFNLGNRRGFSVLEVVHVVELVTESYVPVTRGDRCTGDLAAFVGDAIKAREALGWQPQIAGLRRHRPDGVGVASEGAKCCQGPGLIRISGA
jgi:UDP-glucose 4-epimerase